MSTYKWINKYDGLIGKPEDRSSHHLIKYNYDDILFTMFIKGLF